MNAEMYMELGIRSAIACTGDTKSAIIPRTRPSPASAAIMMKISFIFLSVDQHVIGAPQVV